MAFIGLIAWILFLAVCAYGYWGILLLILSPILAATIYVLWFYMLSKIENVLDKINNKKQ